MPLAAVVLAPDAGLRLVHEGRGWDFAVAPGRVVALAEDFQHLAAVDAATGKPLWRVQAQTQPMGRHNLHVQGERLILHAGPARIHVDLRSGAIVGRASGYYNGGDSGCGLRIVEGDQRADWAGWIAPHRAGAACAEACECSLRLFACGDGAAIGTPFLASETHLYHSLSEPHDTVCWNPPALLLRAATATIVRVEDEQHQPSVLGLDPASGATLWQRPELAEVIGAHTGHAGVDPAGALCWVADRVQLVVFTCATGATRWRLRLGEPETIADTSLTWHKGQLLVQHRDAVRTQLSLHDGAGGARRWQQRLPADRLVLSGGASPPLYSPGPPVAAYVIVDPGTGLRRGEIAVVPGKQVLRPAPEGGYLRLDDAQLAEFDRDGKLLRERPQASDHIAGVSTRHLVELQRDHVRVLRRDNLQPVLHLPGSWQLAPSEAALGPDALVLIEHRGAELPRVLLLRP